MSTSHLRLVATVTVVALAAITGAVTGLLAAPTEASFAVVAALAGFVGACITGLVPLAVVMGRLSAAPANTGGVDGDAAATIEHLTNDRRSLVDTCIYVRDRVTSQAIADRIGASLETVGVTTLSPLGQRFDPTAHEAGGTTPAPDHQRDGVIAAVETVGYLDHAVVVRHPIVTVYRAQG